MADVVLSNPHGLPPGAEGSASDVEEMTCKGCREILEEGKAFELAGNRWHIDCFVCTQCGSALDSDANLLLLGDGSLLCNNCTYNCAACNNKIEDLAILTGDQAFCSTCFKCRNCKRDIENLRYARTSQGIFCMDCHQKLMTRRRKRKAEAREQLPRNDSNGSGSNSATVEKSLPALPPKSPAAATFLTDSTDIYNSPSERSPMPTSATSASSYQTTKRSDSATSNTGSQLGQPPSSHYSDFSSAPHDVDTSHMKDEDFLIPVAFDPSPGPYPALHTARTDHSRSPDPSSTRSGSSRDYFGDHANGQQRSNSSERDAGRLRTPHIASYEKGRQSSTDMAEALRKRRGASNSSSGPGAHPPAPIAPPERSRSRQYVPTAANESAPSQETAKLQQQPLATQNGYSPAAATTSTNFSPQASSNSPVVDSTVVAANNRYIKTSTNTSPTIANLSAERPPRDDSYSKQTIPRKELPRSNGELSPDATPKTSDNKPFATKPQPDALQPSSSSRAPEIPGTRLIADDGLPARSPFRSNFATNKDGETMVDKTSDLRGAASPAPTTSTAVTDQADGKEPGTALPSWTSEKNFSADDDEASKNMGGNGQDDQEPSILRKMSMAVKHTRSQSDRLSLTTTPSKLRNGRRGSVDISSPVNVTPDSKEEASALRSKLRYAQQRIVDLEAEKNSLQEKVNGSTDMRQVNTELREKRSTVAFLAAQQAMVSRELEVMTEEIKKAKEDSNEPLDIEQLKANVLRDFAISLNSLKERLGTQIEALIVKKNELNAEISNLIQMKDKGFQEYESLSAKNQQLSELNSQLIHNIQELHRAGKGPPLNLNVNGLGIYSNNNGADGRVAMDSADADDSAAILSAPKVIDLRKGQVKKFNWKKGGRDITTGIRQGLKGAFQSDKSSMPKEEQFTETASYANLQAGETPVSGPTPVGSRAGNDGRKDAWGFLSQREKASGSQRSGPGSASGGRETNGVGPDSSVFGSDLTERCEHEKRVVPTIVSRCIEEVETRGIAQEGIYRKSGSSLQVKAIQQGFERDPATYDISDPDLDIHAVTSCLKQYFRKLPVPLITFDVYDPLLERVPGYSNGDKDEAIKGMRDAIAALPRCHRDTLDYLVFHLGRVMANQSENLMTPLNLAVVFAPTIMRPQSIEREMTDMHAQRVVVQALLEHHHVIFSMDDNNSMTGTTLAGSIAGTITTNTTNTTSMS